MDVTATFSFGKLGCIISTGIKWHCISPEGDYRGIAHDVTKPQIAVYLRILLYTVASLRASKGRDCTIVYDLQSHGISELMHAASMQRLNHDQ